MHPQHVAAPTTLSGLEPSYSRHRTQLSYFWTTLKFFTIFSYEHPAITPPTLYSYDTLDGRDDDDDYGDDDDANDGDDNLY